MMEEYFERTARGNIALQVIAPILLLSTIVIIQVFVSPNQSPLLRKTNPNNIHEFDKTTISVLGEKSANVTEFSKIKQISIIGERNSGTRWTVSHLSKCFNHTLKVEEKLVRHKHWFQHDIDTGRKREGTFVVSQFRDPYQWILAMKHRPHHSPAHCCDLGWKTFVTTEWNTERPESDIAIRDGNLALGIPTSEIQCQQHFSYDQLNSCQLRPYIENSTFNISHRMSSHQPQYEMRNDGSGMPYENILDLRADKIKNHLSVSTWPWVSDFMVVQYEDLVQRGTTFMVKTIERATGVQAHCTPYKPQSDRGQYEMNDDYKRWITDHVDWEAEALIGYTPLD